jgi:methyl-accepting chemotaxis protein
MPDRSTRAQRVRVFVLVLLSLLTAGLFATVARQSWTVSSADTRLVLDERHRLAYLGPLAHLVGALTETQSAAVRGAPVDGGAVQSAVDAVETADHRYRDALGTGQRWDELRGRINVAMAKPGTGSAAYETFAQLLTLTMDLIQRVGDTSDLVHDAQVDSYYVLDTALLRLPEAVVSAGRAADLALLKGKSPLTGADAIQVAVARYDVAQAAAAANASITRSIESTGRSGLGADLAGQLDGFRAAVDQFAPQVILNNLSDPIDADSLPPAAGAVRVNALSLGDAVLSELDGLLAEREASLGEQRQLTVGAAVVVLIALILALWLVFAVSRGRRAAPPSDGRHDDLEPEAKVVPAGGTGERVPADLIDVRHLLDFEEMEFRRTVRVRQPGSDDDHAG